MSTNVKRTADLLDLHRVYVLAGRDPIVLVKLSNRELRQEMRRLGLSRKPKR